MRSNITTSSAEDDDFAQDFSMLSIQLEPDHPNTGTMTEPLSLAEPSEDSDSESGLQQSEHRDSDEECDSLHWHLRQGQDNDRARHATHSLEPATPSRCVFKFHPILDGKHARASYSGSCCVHPYRLRSETL